MSFSKNNDHCQTAQKILIVDDEPDILSVLNKRLCDAGYEVVSASGGREALRIAKLFCPNLIILDLMMPDMNGTEVAEHLKADPATSRIPIVYSTCLLSKKEEAMGSHRENGNVILAKPCDTKKLLQTIQEMLDSEQ